MYDKDKTKKALAAWGNEAIGKAFQSLQEQKLVVRMNERNRFVPVRGYRMSDKYIPQPGILLMCRWGLSLRSYFADTLLDEGEKFFKSLVEVFGQGKGLLISNMTNDGSVFAILSLLASQQVPSPRLPWFLTICRLNLTHLKRILMRLYLLERIKEEQLVQHLTHL